MSNQNPKSPVQRLKRRVQHVAVDSTIGSTIASLADAARTSSFSTLRTRISTFVQNSWLYTWLTKEPEPEVIVIDLRETWTVGPFIALLDWLIERVLPYWRGSMIKRGLTHAVVLGEQAAETRAGQLIIRILEPPEPPEGDTKHSDTGRVETHEQTSGTESEHVDDDR
ncbi:hypothetical protein ACFQFH_14900 [Halobaculum halobium]|uniref:Uncharacterized protein n=1 Tax=Halobaculum halobium TaxID=3032281 RepID=A0ABD5TDK3_9EURY|nr:hypothetical protein [Halobaculum sp. SYNS20]